MKAYLLLFFVLAGVISSCKRDVKMAVIQRYKAFPSQYADSRQVDVWLPAGYDSTESQRYSVLYMHDGQNLFDTATSYGAREWKVDEMVTSLIEKGQIDSCIVVGIWNTPKRFLEYAPDGPFQLLPDSVKTTVRNEFQGGDATLSDGYLRFVVEELKPFIDNRYKTRADRAHTFIMGSSMGGLISLYALAVYPDVFGGAACLSTHWPFSLQQNSSAFTRATIRYLMPRIENLRHAKIYFDYGTTTLDAWYEPHQKLIDSMFTANGFTERNYRSLKFEGAAHSEDSWALRLDRPLGFLMGKEAGH